MSYKIINKDGHIAIMNEEGNIIVSAVSDRKLTAEVDTLFLAIMYIAANAKSPVVVNCTKHNVTVYNESTGEAVVFPPCGYSIMAHEEAKVVHSFELGGATIRLFSSEFEVIEEPPVIEGVLWIVSSIVKSASDRKDFVVPYGTIRKEVDGKSIILGCKGFAI